MTYFKLGLIALQVLTDIFRWLDKQGIIKDEQRKELLRQLQLAAVAAGIKNKHKEAASKLDEQQVDIAIGDDFRD